MAASVLASMPPLPMTSRTPVLAMNSGSYGFSRTLVVGPAAEERFGSAKVFFAVLLTAIAGAAIMWFLFPEATIMGASGVLFCMMMLASFASMRGGAIPITLILVIILYLGSEVLQAVSGTAGLPELTHIAGGVVGLLLGFAFSRGVAEE